MSAVHSAITTAEQQHRIYKAFDWIIIPTRSIGNYWCKPYSCHVNYGRLGFLD